ncbi:5-methylthioadenosine/S-adenosylhomocysteine deaminase [Thauera sp. GDN1]|uniref:TRZ/ATZ family hydrolase n=1 Tax=Thauera sp. GDN1 TaxID=2944810 RepID=UPI0024794F74|nr:TRZ/ATZ family hydrolase [Thauera sp. GDN1]WEN41829.1 5-methylthioadenosine/S-adenosylhomocysteine deaminase [Thauera sp. GDN1]
MSETVDLVIRARWIVPVEPAGLVLEHHAVAVRDGRIVDVLPYAQAGARYAAARTVDLPSHLLMPGMVNLHVHAAMNLMRGIADDMPLMRWLQEAIWPTEARHVSAAFVRDGTRLAAAEMLRGGVTTCNDMYFHPEAAAEAFAEMGMRAVVGLVMLEFPTPFASDADDYLRKGLAARDRWQGHPLIGFSIAPHAPYTVSDASFGRALAIADELSLPIHIHVHETAHEIAESVAAHGKRPLSRLASLGVLGENLIGVHAVHLDDDDVELLARHACSVAHCPTSNMKLASGIAPVPKLQAAGVRVGLGTDGAASNNRLDLMQEMRHAALLAKVGSGDASALPVHAALRMATLDGARALGMDDRIGSIERGKLADLCAVDLGALDCQPCFDPVSHVVHVAGREHVSHVWVNGETRVDKGIPLLHINDSELLRLASVWQTRLRN